VGIVLAALSLVVMPMLTYAKLHTGRDMGSRALVADSQRPGFAHTCRWRYFELGGFAIFGWWRADPIGALAKLHVVWTDRGAIQVLRRHCPEPARRFEATE
jgi:divalent metal cation (Fe/Co/Zn/Cd) transporter